MATMMAQPANQSGMPLDPVDFQHTPDHPQLQNMDELDQALGIPVKWRDKIVETITSYRTGWAPDRLLRIPLWMRNLLMFRGSQLLAWDPGNSTYFDAYAWYRQNQKEGDAEDTYLEKYGNNITQMLETGFVGTMSRGVPPTVVRPENAEILADVTTAKAAGEAIAIIERLNKIRQMVRIENNLLYLYGCYFKYTRGVLDGDWAGWDYEDQYGSVTVSKPDRYHCFRCGKDTPAEAFTGDEAKTCPFCGTALGPESFFPSESSQEMSIAGQKKVPRAMVKWSVHGPMEVDVDPMAKTLADTPILALDQEVDIGALRLTFPTMFAQITEGNEVGTTPNASYEKLRRNEIYSMGWGYTSDSSNQKPTFSQNWVQPIAYGRSGDQEFSAWMLDKFPEGCKVSLVGTAMVDIKPANLVKQWSSCQLHENVGMYPPAIADNVVPFNIRLNDTMDMIDDWVERCAMGMTIYDSEKIDRREMAGRVMSPGVLNGIKTKGSGIDKPLSDAIMQFKFELDPQVFTYPNMLITMCELISGVTPQTFGGGSQQGIETAAGQRQALDTAQTKLNIFWENLKEEHAQASQNALECLQKLMKAGAVKEIWDVIEAQGSEFRNKYVNWDKMQGHIKVYPDIDQGLPQSPEQIRQTMMQIIEMSSKGNPIIQELMGVVPNQEQMMAVLGTPDMVLPAGKQRSRTLQHINTLMEQGWSSSIDPETGQQVNQLPVKPNKLIDDFGTLRDTVREFCQENSDYELTNPGGWERVLAYLQLAIAMETAEASDEQGRQLKVKMAGMPPPKQPDPLQVAAAQEAVKDGAHAIDRLMAIADGPPPPPGVNITPLVSAASKVATTAVDTARLQAGGK